MHCLHEQQTRKTVQLCSSFIQTVILGWKGSRPNLLHHQSQINIKLNYCKINYTTHEKFDLYQTHNNGLQHHPHHISNVEPSSPKAAAKQVTKKWTMKPWSIEQTYPGRRKDPRCEDFWSSWWHEFSNKT